MQLEDKTNETNLYESKYNALKEENKKTKEIRDYYNTVSFPDEPLELIEQMFKHADKVAINAICGYLKHDNQEMIKNLAKTMNPENQAMLIAYKDGAIGRNEALIKKLETLKKDKFNDRLEGTEKVIR
jgi:hypothetical protein